MKDEVQQTQGNGQQPARQPASREALLEAISNEEALLARLDGEQADARARLAALHAELASVGSGPEIRVCLRHSIEAPIPRTSAEKVKLFRSLFRGREGVFPTRFVAKKTGKPGLSRMPDAAVSKQERRHASGSNLLASGSSAGFRACLYSDSG